ncbi:MAG: hypothetical protein AAFQ29_07975 [Pseudomonadota bacterium]
MTYLLLALFRLCPALMIIFCGIAFSVAVHGQSPDLVSKLQTCKAIVDDSARLVCLDRALGALPAIADPNDQAHAVGTGENRLPTAQNGESPAVIGEARTPTVSGGISSGIVSAQTPEDQFGSSDLSRRDAADKSLNKIEVAVSEILLTRAGRYVIRLENGQEWRQLRADTKKLRFSGDASGEIAILQSKLFGSHSLRLAGSNRSIRVERRK